MMGRDEAVVRRPQHSGKDRKFVIAWTKAAENSNYLRQSGKDFTVHDQTCAPITWDKQWSPWTSSEEGETNLKLRFSRPMKKSCGRGVAQEGRREVANAQIHCLISHQQL